MEAILALLAKGWALISSSIPAIIGAAFSVLSNKDKASELSNKEKFITFFIGWYVAFVGGGSLVEYFSIKETSSIASFITFTIGFIGMGIMVELKTQVPSAIKALRIKYLGE